MADGTTDQDGQGGFGRAVAVPEGRILRATRLGGVAAGVAGNVATRGLMELGRGRRPVLRDLLLTPTNLHRITDELARMRGAAMKLGQLVSMDAGDILPPELAQIMSRLRAEADFMPPAQLRDVLNANWGKDWQRAFRRFDVRPIAAASIGQVHRALLRDGRDVAIKVQYPGVSRSIDSDVANVASLIKLSGLLPKGFELAPYIEETRKQLHAETDYVAEGGHLEQFSQLLKDAPFDLPVLHADWTTPHVLTMSFVESVPLDGARDEDQATRNRLVIDLITLTLREMFEFGVMQTDPNFANFRFNPVSGQIVLLDFGATRLLDPDITQTYARLLRAGLDDDMEMVEAQMRSLGLIAQDTAEEYLHQIKGMADIAFDALRKADLYDFNDQTVSQTLQARGMALAESGFVPPPVPIDVLFLQRKLAGVFLIATQLSARLDLRGLIEAQLPADI